MRRRRLLWQLFPSYLLISAAVLAVAGWQAARSLRTFYYEALAEDLRSRVRLAEALWGDRLAEGAEVESLQAACRELGRATGTRLTLVTASGRVLADSEDDPARMDNHGGRPEILEAATEGLGQATRFSTTVGARMFYVAARVGPEGAPRGYVRAGLPVAEVEASLRRLFGGIAFGAAAAVVLVGGLSWLLARRLTQPLREIQAGARRLAGGDFQSKLTIAAPLELADLAETMNRMAGQLEERLAAIEGQRREAAAVLGSMAEGVIAVDRRQRVLTINGAAAELFGVAGVEAEGRALQEVVLNAELQDFARRIIAGEAPIEGEIVLRAPETRTLQVHGTALQGAGGDRLGAVMVLNDVTRLRRLESLRREFVANVSHELKTPITSIQGFVETLLDGALDQPAEARRFMEIIARQAGRLAAIIEDLLNLSRIEQDEERRQIVLNRAPLAPVVVAAVQGCQDQAAAKGVKLSWTCPPDLTGRINAPLLEQALVNLIDNALKYTGSGRAVEVQAHAGPSEHALVVSDEGCGITAEHLPQLFERFYRVDPARSRSLGGTGLGLAIVKHIVAAHGGRVSVVSAPGLGSRFTIHLPAEGPGPGRELA